MELTGHHLVVWLSPEAIKTCLGVLEPGDERATTSWTVAGQIVGEAGPGLWVRVKRVLMPDGGEMPLHDDPHSVRKLIPRSGSGRPVVVSQQPAQPVPAADLGPTRGSGCRGDQRIPESLMVPLPMVVRHELVQGAEQPALSEQDEAIETLVSDRAHEALRVGVGIRR
jgi:hypothetical protein